MLLETWSPEVLATAIATLRKKEAGAIDIMMNLRSPNLPPPKLALRRCGIQTTDEYRATLKSALDNLKKYFANLRIGSFTEVSTSGTGYARISITNNSGNWPSASVVSGVATKLNGSAIAFGTASANWGTILGIALFDASSSGNLGPWILLSSPITVLSGQSLSVPVSGITFTQG